MPYFNGRYVTDSEVEEMTSMMTSDEEDEFRSRLRSSDDRGSFGTSVAIGAATGSDLLGGIVGDLLEGGGLDD